MPLFPSLRVTLANLSNPRGSPFYPGTLQLGPGWKCEIICKGLKFQVSFLIPASGLSPSYLSQYFPPPDIPIWAYKYCLEKCNHLKYMKGPTRGIASPRVENEKGICGKMVRTIPEQGERGQRQRKCISMKTSKHRTHIYEAFYNLRTLSNLWQHLTVWPTLWPG